MFHVPFALEIEIDILATETVFISLEFSLSISLTRFTDMDLLSLVREVQTEAEALSSGDKVARARLLHAIHKLTLAAETPTQTLMRISFQVRTFNR